jgi:hypothetical protein
LGDDGFERLAMKDVKPAASREASVTSNDVLIGVVTTVSELGRGVALATSTRGSLATAGVAGNVRAASATLRASNDQTDRK